MNLLAIDPGPVVSGWVLVDTATLKVLASGKESPTSEVISAVRKNEIAGLPFDSVACEMIASYGMAVGAEVFDTCTRIGRIEEAWESTTGGIVRRVFRQKAKMHLCNSPRAKDANVSQALKDKLGEVGTSKSPGPLYGIAKHAWAALAVAVYAVEVAEES